MVCDAGADNAAADDHDFCSLHGLSAAFPKTAGHHVPGGRALEHCSANCDRGGLAPATGRLTLETPVTFCRQPPMLAWQTRCESNRQSSRLADVEKVLMNHAKALLTNALLFGLLTATCALPAQQGNSRPNDAPEPAKSLGEIAKEAKKNKAVPAKKVITDENLDVPRSPLPKLNLEGTENFQEIVL